MVYTLFLLLLFVYAVSFFEERLKRYNLAIYAIVWVVLVFCATTKEVGFDNDSENYEYFFLHYDDPIVSSTVEASYIWLSQLLFKYTSDVHYIFFIYAIIGITLKLYAIRRMSNLMFLPLLIYIGNYFILQDMTQIRAGVVTGIFLLALKPLAEGNKRKAALLILLSCFFHYSALILFLALLFNNNEIEGKHRIFWAMLVPIGYLLALINFNPLTVVQIPYITDKVERYQYFAEINGDRIIFNLLFLITCTIYLYSLCFYDAIKRVYSFLPIMIKLLGLAIIFYLLLSRIPVIAIRISELFRITEVFLFASIAFTMKPRWLGVALAGGVAIFQFVFNVIKILN